MNDEPNPAHEIDELLLAYGRAVIDGTAVNEAAGRIRTLYFTNIHKAYRAGKRNGLGENGLETHGL
jgi:hypothetical protein